MASYTWVGSGKTHSGDWGTATDWNPNGVPGLGDSVTINKGVATEDIAETGFPGLEIGALKVGASGELVIGDAADTNEAILTVDGVTNGSLLGLVTVYGGSSTLSYLRMSGKVATSSGSTLGQIDLNGGALDTVSSLDLTGQGDIDLSGGYIGGSSSVATNTLTTSATISGVGAITAITHFGGGTAYDGLTTDNHGVIDATNLDSGENFLDIVGGVVHNFGTMEATNSVSSSSGFAVLNLTDDVVVTNETGGSMSAGAGAYIALQGATIVDGGLSGLVGAYGTGNTIEAAKNQQTTNHGTIFASNGSLTLGANVGEIVNDSTVAADSGGTVHLLGLVDNNLNATMVAYSGGLITTAKTNSLLNSGTLEVDDSGEMICDDAVVGTSGKIDIDDGIFEFNNDSSSGNVYFNNGGTLVFGKNDIDGSGVLDGSVNNFVAGDFFDFETVTYSSVATGGNCKWTQSSGTSGILQVGAVSLGINGVYASVGQSYTFGANGVVYSGSAGSPYFTVFHGMDNFGHSLPGVAIGLI